MKKINTYIIEKLKINKNSKLKHKFDLDIPYLSIERYIVKNELKVGIMSTIMLRDINEEKGIIEFFVQSGSSLWLKRNYILVNNRIMFGPEENYNITKDSDCKIILLPKDEAITFLKNLPKDHYVISMEEYFGEEKGIAAVREAFGDALIKDNDIEKHIEDLENA